MNNLKKGIRPLPDNGAGNGVRTRDPKLGKLVLYQLSYARIRFYPRDHCHMIERMLFPALITDKNAYYKLINR